MLRLCLTVFCLIQFQGALSSYICNERSKTRSFPVFSSEYPRDCSCCNKQSKQTTTVYHDKSLYRFPPIYQCDQCNFSHSDKQPSSESIHSGSKTLSQCASDILMRSKQKPILSESRRIVHEMPSSTYHTSIGDCTYLPSSSSLIDGCASLPVPLSQPIRVVRESPPPTEMPEVVERGRDNQMEAAPQQQEPAMMDQPHVETETINSGPQPMEPMDEGEKSIHTFRMCNEEVNDQSLPSDNQSPIPFSIQCENEVTPPTKDIPMETISMETETSEQKAEEPSQTIQEVQPTSPPCLEGETCSSTSPVYSTNIEEEMSPPLPLENSINTEEVGSLPSQPPSDPLQNEIESQASSLVLVPRPTRGASHSTVTSCSTTCLLPNEICPRPTSPPITTVCNKPCSFSLTNLLRNFNPISTTLKSILPSCRNINSPCFPCPSKSTYSILPDLSSCAGRTVGFKPVYEEVIRHVPIVKNVIRNRVVETTRHVPVVEKTVLQEQNKIIRHIPIVQTVRRNVVECRTNHIPVVQHRTRTIEEPYTVHVAHTEKITRPVIDSYVQHVPVVVTQTKPVVRERIRHVPVVETRCRPVIEDTITTVPVKRRVVKNIVELKLRPVIAPCEDHPVPEPREIIIGPEGCDPCCETECPY